MDGFKKRYAWSINFGQNNNFLDLGAGHKLHPEATHVIDYKDDNTGRQGRDLQIKAGVNYFHEGAPESFKHFGDKFFDFIYSSHTVEHIPKLTETIAEIKRTGKRGFFSFPGSDFDFMTSWSHGGHIHAMRQRGNTILWCNKNKWFDDLAFLFQEKMYKPKHHLSLMENDYRYLWECRYYWEGEPLFRQVDPEEIYPQIKYFK